VSPALPWVPWALVPHLPGLGLCPHTRGTMLHDDCQSPLSPRFTWRWRCHTWLASPLCVPSPARGRLEALRPRQGCCAPGTPPLPGKSVQETTGSPTCPSAPLDDMPRAQTPVVSWARAAVAPRIAAFRRMHTVGFPPPYREGYPCGPRLYVPRGSSRGPSPAPSPAPPLLVEHVGFAPDRLARRWSGGT
jgi:hypothetical protein